MRSFAEVLWLVLGELGLSSSPWLSQAVLHHCLAAETVVAVGAVGKREAGRMMGGTVLSHLERWRVRQ